jgi:endonuclease/exonuclease/phosphatase family metal-dependent hydrolase
MKHGKVPIALVMVLLLLAAVLSACVETAAGRGAIRTAGPLRVLTYNIHHGEGMDGKFDYDRLAAVIARARPDLVALQEVDRGTRRAGGVDQAAVLAQKIGMRHAFGEAMPYSGGSYGEAVLSRFPLESVANHPLSCGEGQEPRAALAVIVRPWGPDGPELLFAGTHLCHQSAVTRLRQVQEIGAALEDRTGPAVLAGDFNFGPDTQPYGVLAKNWLDAARDAGAVECTFGAGLPPEERRKRIDFVWIRKERGLRVLSAEVIEEPLASDHLPVLVVLEYADTDR